MARERVSRCVLCIFMVTVVLASEDPVVKVQQGLLKGKSLTSIASKKQFFGFLGIPYAKPPVGDLKFKAPVPAEPWTGIREAVSEGNICAQRNELTRLLTGEDDCLYLNVYTPGLPKEGGKDLKPVMFLIHGGGFYFGSGGRNVYGADYLVDEGVLLVTINYRLGPQGFLSLETPEVPGNAGLKDQVIALRWVRENIKQFGGDPKNVTLIGQSAGGASVQYHMLSPMSKGLFQRAIAQSGTPLNIWAFRNTTRDKAFRLGEKLGLKTSDPQELVQFLRGIKTLELTKASHEVLTLEEKPLTFGVPFLPTTDTESEGEVFLPADPKQILSYGDINDVPVIAGVTSHEGILAINILNEIPNALGILDKEFERAIPLDFPVTRRKFEAEEIAKKIKRFYFGDQPISEKTMVEFVNLITDVWFIKDINAAVQKLAERSSQPVYYYEFSFSGKFGILKRLLGAEELPGAAHADELGYLFSMLLTSRLNLPAGDPSLVTLKRMVRMWTNFAKTGNPTPEEDPLLNVTWSPYTKENHVYLNIDQNLTLQEDLNKERLQFWEALYENAL